MPKVKRTVSGPVIEQQTPVTPDPPPVGSVAPIDVGAGSPLSKPLLKLAVPGSRVNATGVPLSIRTLFCNQVKSISSEAEKTDGKTPPLAVRPLPAMTA